jgi:hypothetical protein
MVNTQFQAVALASIGQNKSHSPIRVYPPAMRPGTFQVGYGSLNNGGNKGMITGGYALPRHETPRLVTP